MNKAVQDIAPGNDVTDGFAIVSDLADFDRLRADWTRVHAADPNAGVFLSFPWLRALLAERPGEWQVHVLREAGRSVAFLPLRLSLHWSRTTTRFQTQLAAAGHLGMSAYTGFVCAPEDEDSAIPALGLHMARQPWARLSLRHEPTRHRLDLFADTFDARRFDVSWPAHRSDGGRVNQLVSARVALPERFDAWLGRIDPDHRDAIRRALRDDMQGRGLLFRRARGKEALAEADALLKLWSEHDRAASGDDRTRSTRRKYRAAVAQAEANGMLYMPTLWDGDRMLGGIAHVLDPKSRSLIALFDALNPDTGGVDAGLLMRVHAIRAAIAAGLASYDFGHGDDAYKYSYGAEDFQLGYMVITRRSPETDPVLDPAQSGPALKRVLRFFEKDRPEDGLAGLRQIVELG